MIDLQIKEQRDCMGCYGCYNICPENCISMESDNEGFWYPQVDYDKCIECKRCIKVCPIINKTVVNNEPLAYACTNKNKDIRLKSSSGGIFTLVADQILKEGGIVFGAGFDQDFNLIHSYTKSQDELDKYRGSKYLQSKIGDTYKEAKKFLLEGKKVLFTGTPCQIGGLKSFLGKSYENLFSMDNICHGVPSPKVWEKYLDYREAKAKSSAKTVSFRNKEEGWKKFSVYFSFENNKEYRKDLREDYFMKAFLKDICLRPSCHSCEFKTLHRESDITMADFWGIDKIMPHMDDDTGLSLIFVNSPKGEEMFDMIKDHMLYEKTDINEAVLYNSAAIKSVNINPARDGFFDDLESYSFDKLVKKYCVDKTSVRIKRKIKSLIKYKN